MTSEKTAEKIAKKITRSDEAARKDFFKREISAHMDSLYGVAMRLTRNPHDAEDLIADTMTKAWAAIDSLEDQTRFKPWIFRILNNTFISNCRKKNAEPEKESYDENADDDEDIFSLFDRLHQPFLLWWSNPEQEYVNSLLKQDIATAIEGLAPGFRMAVMLVDVEGLSYEEAATAMDVPIGTVRSRLKRARTLLQKNLWEHAAEAGLGAPPEEKVPS